MEDIGIRLIAAMSEIPAEDICTAIKEDPLRDTAIWANRLAACAEAIIAERIKKARLETLRSSYNVVCREFSDPGLDDYDAGVTACRDAIAKLIEGEIP